MRPSVLYWGFLPGYNRRERHIRQARVYANIAPYRSPRREPGTVPLRDIRNAPAVQHGPELKERRSAQHDADRECQLALQETPNAGEAGREPCSVANAKTGASGPLLQLGRLRCLQIDTCWHSKHGVNRNVRLLRPPHKQVLKPLRLLHRRGARRLSECGANVNSMPVKSVRIAGARPQRAPTPPPACQRQLSPPADPPLPARRRRVTLPVARRPYTEPT
ncbi:hypothetical protein B0H13DRAFT_1879016 [Mycena leptocephala]|nr:hypothetical protein B0H13DRAFT_1879016 [Mycena leptocephala]